MTERTIGSNLTESTRSSEQQPQRKASFNDIYNAPHPGPYFSTLKPLDYRIPHFAQPVIQRLVNELRQLRGRNRITILDLCAGYGVNGALLKYDISLDQIYQMYDSGKARTAEGDRAALASRCREDSEAVRVIGQDVASRALAYAKAAGFLDETLHVNLEEKDLTEAQEDLIAETDLVTITGGLSYIGEATLLRVFGALHRPPWVLYYPLRGSETDTVNDALCEAGLRPERWHKPLPQRRFANDMERRNAFGITDLDTDGLGPASSTFHQAVLYLARPVKEARKAPFAALVTGFSTPLA
ncbi:MAG TPA: class I SAM-dependent methyltransferase [Aestuariivirga sp.]|mgnify:CR=1 FL=1|nr:class I SAM-dependent methyltransferase [Aestuariivirga sp.]